MQHSYKTVRVTPDHPLARYSKIGHIGVHRVVLFEKIGDGEHACHWCGTALRWRYGAHADSVCVDHLDGNDRNNDPSNLVPSCNKCNRLRTQRIPEGALFIVKSTGKRERAEWAECQMCGVDFLRFVYRRKNSRGECCSRGCTYANLAERRAAGQSSLGRPRKAKS